MDSTKNSLSEFLFVRFKENDERAFEHIFKNTYNKLVGFCTQFVSEREQAKGIAQESFVNLWLNREKIEKPTGINAFLYTAARSACLKYLRHQQVVERYTDLKLNEIEKQIQYESLDSFDFNSIEFAELSELVKQSIDKLPEKCRAVFKKKRFDGKTNREVAEEIGITIKSVEANMTRALKVLKTDLVEYLPFYLLMLSPLENFINSCGGF